MLDVKLRKVNSILLGHFREVLSQAEKFYPTGFSKEQIEVFSRYYELVLKWNDRLHLTTVTSPRDFAVFHILESAFAVPYLLPFIQNIIDLGSGCGIPAIPLAILRPDLTVTLVEASKKKAIFLKEVATSLGADNLKIINQRFETVDGVTQDVCITLRALDKLSQMIPTIMNLGQNGGQFLIFGNDSLLDDIQLSLPPGWHWDSHLIPRTINRLLIVLSRST